MTRLTLGQNAIQRLKKFLEFYSSTLMIDRWSQLDFYSGNTIVTKSERDAMAIIILLFTSLLDYRRKFLIFIYS